MTTDMLNFQRPDTSKSLKRRIRNGSAVVVSGTALGLVVAGGVRMISDYASMESPVKASAQSSAGLDCKPDAAAYTKELVGASAKVEVIKAAGYACLRLKSTGEAWGQPRQMSLELTGDVNAKDEGSELRMYAGWLMLPEGKCARVIANATSIPDQLNSTPTLVESSFGICYTLEDAANGTKTFNSIISE